MDFFIGSIREDVGEPCIPVRTRASKDNHRYAGRTFDLVAEYPSPRSLPPLSFQPFNPLELSHRIKLIEDVHARLVRSTPKQDESPILAD